MLSLVGGVVVFAVVVTLIIYRSVPSGVLSPYPVSTYA
jgi:hypothetical protein